MAMAMGIAVRLLLLVSIYVLSLSTAVNAIQGNAVFYKWPYTPSKCYGNRNDGVMVAGVSDALWGGGAACGRRYRVRCIGAANLARNPCKQNTFVDVKVVDYCQETCNGIINLSQDAFSRIAETTAGKVRVQIDQI